MIETTEVIIGAEPIELESLLVRCLGKRELANRILKRFAEATDNSLREFDMAIACCEWVAAAKVLHRLRGSALSASANRLAEAIEPLEKAIQQNQDPDSSPLMPRFREECLAVSSWIQTSQIL